MIKYFYIGVFILLAMMTLTGCHRTKNKNQLILVYCRSGNRSKQASKKLVDMGYTNIKEFGGITSWEGEIVAE